MTTISLLDKRISICETEANYGGSRGNRAKCDSVTAARDNLAFSFWRKSTRATYGRELYPGLDATLHPSAATGGR